MNHGWKYQHLGDITTIKSGCTPSQSDLHSYGEFPYFKVAEMNLQGNEKYLIKTTSYLSGHIKTFPENSIVFPKNGAAVSTNKKRILKVSSVVDLNTAVMLCDGCVDYRYIYYSIVNIDFTKLVKRGAVPTLNIPELKQKLIPVPSLEIQTRIVDELDKINELIEVKRSQLADLDLLAQSLFSEMFGDPITNPKGFAMKQLGDICEISSAKRVLVEDVVESGIPFIRGTELAILSKQITFDSSVFTMFITQEHYDKVKSITGVPNKEDLLIPSINPKGVIWEVNTSSPFYFKDGRVLWVHLNRKEFYSKWLKFALSKVIKEKYSNLSRGAVFSELTLIFLRSLDMVVPPLEMQRLFAAKMEAIEAQKKLIESSLTDLQTLLASRMDYWFND